MRRQHDTVSTEQQNSNRDNLRESRGCALARPSVVHGHAPLREARLEESRKETVRGSRARDPASEGVAPRYTYIRITKAARNLEAWRNQKASCPRSSPKVED